MTDPRIEAAFAVAARTGEVRSGDQAVIVHKAESTLVGVVDGLGHGDEAAVAAERAVSVLMADPSDSVVSLVRHCHEKLWGTRGVVMSLASIKRGPGTMTWLGIGNADALLVRADPVSQPRTEWVLLRGGIVGARLPPLMESTVSLASGDTLIFATDGVDDEFAVDVSVEVPTQQLADRILERHRRPGDDSLVLVARYFPVADHFGETR